MTGIHSTFKENEPAATIFISIQTDGMISAIVTLNLQKTV